MNLQFLLTVKGHDGIPDGGWSLQRRMADDVNTTVEQTAQVLIRERVTARGRMTPAEVDAIRVEKAENSDYAKVFYTDNEQFDYVDIVVVPVLVVGERMFELKEIE